MKEVFMRNPENQDKSCKDVCNTIVHNLIAIVNCIR